MDLAYIGYQHIISAVKNLQFHDKGPFLWNFPNFVLKLSHEKYT